MVDRLGLGSACFSTLSRRQKTLKVNIPYLGSDGPLHLLVDSTGIKIEGEGVWDARNYGGAKRRVLRKIHIAIDEKTLEIRAAEFTTSDVGDAPMLLELLDQIPPDQEIASVTADGAFDTRKCNDAIAVRGAAAITLPRKNAKPWNSIAAGSSPGTKSCGHQSAWVEPSGDDGVDITAEAEPRARCIVSSCSGSASPPATSTLRSQRSKSALPS